MGARACKSLLLSLMRIGTVPLNSVHSELVYYLYVRTNNEFVIVPPFAFSAQAFGSFSNRLCMTITSNMQCTAWTSAFACVA